MKIPKEWSELTLKQYYELIDVIAATSLTETEKACRAIVAVTGEKETKVEDLSISEFKQHYKSILELVDKPIDKRVPASFKVNGKVYIFEYKRPIAKAKHLMVLSQLTKEKKDTIYNLHKIMANFCECKTDKKQTYEERAKEFYNHMTIDIAYGVSAFFLNISIQLLQNIQTSLEKKSNKMIQELQKEGEKLMKKDGAGLFGWINFLKKRAKSGTISKNGTLLNS